MENYIDYHSDKRRRLDNHDVGREALVHWKGPSFDKIGCIGEAALDGMFGSRKNWRFVTNSSKTMLVVISRLKREKPLLPFF